MPTAAAARYVGGRGAPVGTLAEIGGHLVAVHGQTGPAPAQEPAGTARSAGQVRGGAALAQALTAYAGRLVRWKEAKAELETLRTEARERLREAEHCRLALEEIDGVDPQPGEDNALKAVAVKLANVEELRAAATGHTRRWWPRNSPTRRRNHPGGRGQAIPGAGPG